MEFREVYVALASLFRAVTYVLIEVCRVDHVQQLPPSELIDAAVKQKSELIALAEDIGIVEVPGARKIANAMGSVILHPGPVQQAD